MTALLLELKTAFACPCAPGGETCPYCRGEDGAIPNVNRAALDRAKEILLETGISPVSFVESGAVPDASSRRGKRFCVGPLDTENGAFLAEGKDGAALLVFTGDHVMRFPHLPTAEIAPDDALRNLPEAFYPAMDLPPIEW